jgi:hypothetical protein
MWSSWLLLLLLLVVLVVAAEKAGIVLAGDHKQPPSNIGALPMYIGMYTFFPPK